MTAYYTPTGNPPNQARGTSSSIRAEFVAVQAGFTAAQADILARAIKAGDAYTGTHDFTGAVVKVPTQTAGDNSTNAASTAFVVATSLNANLPGQGGNSGKFITTNGTTASWAFTTISKSFTSAEQTITSAGSLTIAHGLAVIPPLIFGYLKCVTGELGYSIGDVVCVPLGLEYVSGSNQGLSVVPDATNLHILFGSAANVFGILNKSTGNGSLATNANWTFSVRAFA